MKESDLAGAVLPFPVAYLYDVLLLAVFCKIQDLKTHREIGRELFCGDAEGFGREGYPAVPVAIANRYLREVYLFHGLQRSFLVPLNRCGDRRQVIFAGDFNLAAAADAKDTLFSVAGPAYLISVDHRREAALFQDAAHLLGINASALPGSSYHDWNKEGESADACNDVFRPLAANQHDSRKANGHHRHTNLFYWTSQVEAAAFHHRFLLLEAFLIASCSHCFVYVYRLNLVDLGHLNVLFVLHMFSSFYWFSV